MSPSPKQFGLTSLLVGLACTAQAHASPIWSANPKGHVFVGTAINWQTLKPLHALGKPVIWQPTAINPGIAKGNPFLNWSNPPPTAFARSSSSLQWSVLAAPDVVDSSGLPVDPPKPAPLTLAEVQHTLAQLPNQPSDYSPLVKLGQLPTATLWNDATFQVTGQQVSPLSGGASGGSGNQNYSLRGDLQLTDTLLLSAYWTYWEDGLYKAPASKPTNPDNLWTVYGAALKGRLAGGKAWQWAAEGALELFSVGSGCGSNNLPCFESGSGSDNIFNNSGQKVATRNVVGSLALPLSWQASKQLQLSFVPAVSWLPSSQGAGQGGAGEFFGTNISLGLGANYRPTPQLQLFSSARMPLGPGTNSFDSNLVYSRTPILSLGANVAVNPRIGLEASITNGFGLSPSTAILALPSAPWQPMLSGRFSWTPGAPDSKSPNYTTRQASLALGGLGVNTALTPASGTKQVAANVDSRGNVLGLTSLSLSNDMQLQVAGGQFNGIDTQNSFESLFIGNRGFNFRFGPKIMVMRATKRLPIWTGLHTSWGYNFQSNGTTEGYLFVETIHTWEATPWLAFNLNPKLANSGLGTPWGIGMSANIQLGNSFQLIPEINAVATNFGGTNDTNGSLNLRWLASAKTTLDLYVSNAAGLLDMGQLLGGNQIRVGSKLTLSF